MLSYKIKETKAVIKKALELSEKPLVLNYSGGKDSLLLLDIIQQITDKFIPFFCYTGIEFEDTFRIVKNSAKERDLQLLISYPEDHKGGFFERIKVMKCFPGIRSTWCSRDLKFRPQKKVLQRKFGKGAFYKLNAVRKYESNRRNKIYRSDTFFKEDYHVYKDIMVFPILNWTTEERNRYFEKKAIKIEINELYEKFGVSGCFYCPFYQHKIYRKILESDINKYNEFIKWEALLNKPAVINHKFLRDLKEEVKNQRKITEFL